MSAPRRDSPAPRPAPLPAVRASLATDQIVERLDKASRRGKLPGFRRARPGSPIAFVIEVFGKYFDRRMFVRIDGTAPGAMGAGSVPESTLRFDSRVKPSRVVVFWAVVVLSIWPGVLLTDSLLATYFSWYPREFWVTCLWYLPLTVVPVPWMWRAWWRESAVIADAEARKSIGDIAGHLGATVVEPA